MTERPRMRRVIAIVLSLLLAATVPAGAKLTAADISSTSCERAEINSADTLAGEAAIVEVAADPYSSEKLRAEFSVAKLQSDLANYNAKGFQQWRSGVTGCKDMRRRNSITAMENTDIAIIMHALNPATGWQTKLTLANQQLEVCVTDYYGKTKGAECEMRLEMNIRLKIKWEASSP
jgi:hypothetical protein